MGASIFFSSKQNNNNNSALLSVGKVYFLSYLSFEYKTPELFPQRFSFFQKQTVAVIQGVTAVVIASIPAVDETVNYKTLLECVFILNGVYL